MEKILAQENFLIGIMCYNYHLQFKIHYYICKVSNFLKRIFAFLLLVSFCFYITPKEVLHVFTHHHDTEHLLVNGSQFEEQHHHCELLKIDQAFSAFVVELPFFDFFTKNDFYVNPSESFTNSFFSLFSCSSKQLRAPPVFVG